VLAVAVGVGVNVGTDVGDAVGVGVGVHGPVEQQRAFGGHGIAVPRTSIVGGGVGVLYGAGVTIPTSGTLTAA